MGTAAPGVGAGVMVAVTVDVGSGAAETMPVQAALKGQQAGLFRGSRVQIDFAGQQRFGAPKAEQETSFVAQLPSARGRSRERALGAWAGERKGEVFAEEDGMMARRKTGKLEGLIPFFSAFFFFFFFEEPPGGKEGGRGWERGS